MESYRPYLYDCGFFSCWGCFKTPNYTKLCLYFTRIIASLIFFVIRESRVSRSFDFIIRIIFDRIQPTYGHSITKYSFLSGAFIIILFSQTVVCLKYVCVCIFLLKPQTYNLFIIISNNYYNYLFLKDNRISLLLSRKFIE